MPRMSQRRCNGRKLVAIVGLTFAALAPALAQQPRSEQLQAIRSSCRSDFISHCSGVQPGGRDALECLMRNSAQLSAACGRAVSAIIPKSGAAKSDADKTDTGKSDTGKSDTAPAATAQGQQPASAVVVQPSAATTQQEQLAAVGKACTLDDASHCSWIKSDNPELLLCLKANAALLSPDCQSVVLGTAVSAPVETAAPRPAPTQVAIPKQVAPPKEDTPKRPSSKQASAVRAACRSDFISHCSGVQPGGSAALQCLQHNKFGLSQSCQSALAAAVGGGNTEAADTKTADTKESAPPAAPGGGFAVRRLPLREELAIIRICAPDRNALCGAMPVGGGRIISCLAQNASQLSPRCRAALAAARGG